MNQDAPETEPKGVAGEGYTGAGIAGEGAQPYLAPAYYKLGFIKIPRYHTPMAQIFTVSMVCFLCPGMYNALGGLGGGGQVNPTAQDNASVALYATFAVFGFCSGTICNFIGVKYTLAIGGFGYFIYAAAFLSYNINQNAGFVIFAGALTGFCAGLLWCAQGVVSLAYPEEKDKGKGISIFWAIFNLGGVIGSAIPLGQNFYNTTNTVTNGTYVAFMVLMFAGFVLSFFLLPADKVRRADGSHIENVTHPGVMDDIKGLYRTMITDPWILALFPLFFSSNWFYTYQFNDYNAQLFTLRARSLNSMMYWLMQIFGALLFGYGLDWTRFSRKTRAYAGWVAAMILTCAIWGGGVAAVIGADRNVPVVRLDIYSGGYFVHLFLYMWYGFLDASYQIFIYWTFGALTNDIRKIAYYAGYYKGVQSVGNAIIFRIDALKTPYANIFASSWALMVAGLLCALPVLVIRIRATEKIEEGDEVYIKDGIEVVRHRRRDEKLQ